MIEGMPIPISCPKCNGKMIATRYELVFNFLKERSWQVCKECNFQRTADDFKKSLLTV
jgi:C4-type Zn-finger protein